MNDQYILEKLTEVINYLNSLRLNSKRIDELPAATEGAKYVAVWNDEDEVTQKMERDLFVNQNNQALFRNIGVLPGNGWATQFDVANFMNASESTLLVSETRTPVLLECKKLNVDTMMRYVFIWTSGKGNWGGPGNPLSYQSFRELSARPENPIDVNTGPDVQIIPLGQLSNESDFLDAANAEGHAFTDPDMTYYFSYYVLYNAGTPQEVNVLNLAQFIGPLGEYGDTNPPFLDEYFVHTNTATQSTMALRLNYGEIYKLGKGYVEDVGGITKNIGPMYEDEKGDFFVGVDLDGYVRFPMRYGGTGDITNFDNHYYEQRVKVRIPGEPGYEPIE